MGGEHAQRGREQNTYKSDVFGAPMADKTNRKILGFGKDAGKDNLIGPDATNW
jgi:hypothetical protein